MNNDTKQRKADCEDNEMSGGPRYPDDKHRAAAHSGQQDPLIQSGFRPKRECHECKAPYNFNHHEDCWTGGLEAELEKAEGIIRRMEKPIHRLVDWCKAYPLDVFPEPAKEDWKRVNEVLKKAGLKGITGFSASNMRHVVEGCTEIANELDKALKMVGDKIEIKGRDRVHYLSKLP